MREYLRTATNRNKRPFASDTINAYLRCARQLARWLDEAGVPGDLTAACDPETFNAFLREYLGGHELNGTSFVQRNLRTLFKWLERETEVPSPFRSEVLDHYVARLYKPKTLTREFVAEVLASCDEKTFVGIRDEGIIRLLLEGLRVGEVADVEPGDVPTLAERVLRVTPHKGELRYAEGSGRRILLEETTIKALHRYLRARAEHPLAATHLAKYLWLGQSSALPFGDNGIRLMLIRRCKRLGYDVHATPQMFRHTFAHDFRANGGARGRSAPGQAQAGQGRPAGRGRQGRAHPDTAAPRHQTWRLVLRAFAVAGSSGWVGSGCLRGPAFGRGRIGGGPSAAAVFRRCSRLR